MAILRILEYPDPGLKKLAAPVSMVDDRIKQLVRDMADTMYQAPGIGLAAIQIAVPLQVIVIDISESKDQLQVLINPEILAKEGEIECEEGCLSVPGYYDKVKRAEKIIVRALDAEGTPYQREAQGLLAVCIQHEIDHLYGTVFVEYLSPLKQTRLKSKIKKRQRELAPAR